MKKTITPSLAAILFAVNSYGVDLNGAIPSDPSSEATAFERAESLVPSNKDKPRKKISPVTYKKKVYQPIQLIGGLQLHPSCSFEIIRRGFELTDIHAQMNSLMTTMFDRMVKCAENYPELRSYIGGTVSTYRKQTIKCESPHATGGILRAQGPISEYGAYYSSYNGQVTLAPETVDMMVAKDVYSQNTLLSTIFHELLHATTANNRHDHNEIERIEAKSEVKNTCRDNVTMDRVSAIESLCMGVPINSSDDRASIILATRISACGPNRGCKDTFTYKGTNFTLMDFFNRLPKKDLNDEEATKLCQRIKDDGICLHLRRTQGKLITDSNPRVKSVRERLKSRLNEILPGLTNEIPTAILDIYPGSKHRFDAIKDNPCLKGHLYIAKGNPEKINFLRNRGEPIQLKSWRDRNPGSHVRNIASHLKDFINKNKSDKCTIHELELFSILNEISNGINYNHSWQSLKRLMAFEAGSKEIFNVLDVQDPNFGISKLIGGDLARDYAEVMDKHHYTSPNFDCVASGLSPFRTIEAAVKPDDDRCK